ncbi:class I SAM-dependent methyltransferase [Oceanospirillum sediminis]|uniref:Class I SAM-dependent methyltransferase n=1 Tax=Oceanospirillum sediminis TaxID=2760088 RepID=A0A839IVL4_9GAMM|nr:class I SAM-dependent methyltransferase [Oceanospirillum sediminis]MBB1488710.1 class I SAM-dependent methyltransferase [Oceanospirillum sediminis]
MSHHAGFWNMIAKRYSRQPIADEASYQKKLHVTHDYLSSESRVLEFGCGTGSTAIFHAPDVAYIHAIDISEQMLNIAEKKTQDAGIENLTFARTDLEHLNSEQESWDVIMGMSVLHLLPDRQAELDRVYQLLKPGGVFISSTACLSDSGLAFRMIAPLLRCLPFLPSVYVFSVSGLQLALKQAGFDIEYQWQPGKNAAVFIVARKPE